MMIRSIRELAATVRGRRLELGLSQAELAQRAGVSRKWIYDFEAGKPTAELGLLMRVLEALELVIDITPRLETGPAQEGDLDLNTYLEEYRRR